MAPQNIVSINSKLRLYIGKGSMLRIQPLQYRIAENFHGRIIHRDFRGLPSANVFSTKFCDIHNAHIVCMREDHTYIIIGPEQSTKVFSTKFSFCTETNVFCLEHFLLYGMTYFVTLYSFI